MNEKPKILYVDDEEINLLLFEINFRKKYHITTALDGLKGLEILEANPEILIVISDMRMPKLNGIEFIKLAKERYPDKRFFILTGFEITEEIQSALKSGLILRYFKKPFDIIEIDSALNQVINKK